MNSTGWGVATSLFETRTTKRPLILELVPMTRLKACDLIFFCG